MDGRDQMARAIPEPEQLTQLISFSVGSEVFGVGILVVQEIIMMSAITEIPNAPDFVEGSSTFGETYSGLGPETETSLAQLSAARSQVRYSNPGGRN